MAAVADQVAIVLDRARQFSNESRTDHLTGLANRREFERVMEREVERAERHGRRLTMMMIDLDNLKRITTARVTAAAMQRFVSSPNTCNGSYGGPMCAPESGATSSRSRCRRPKFNVGARWPRDSGPRSER
jgi:hypothetical protein